VSSAATWITNVDTTPTTLDAGGTDKRIAKRILRSNWNVIACRQKESVFGALASIVVVCGELKQTPLIVSIYHGGAVIFSMAAREVPEVHCRLRGVRQPRKRRAGDPDDDATPRVPTHTWAKAKTHHDTCFLHRIPLRQPER